MELLLEIVLWIAIAPILEVLILAMADKIQKKKREKFDKTINLNNFTMQYSKDAKIFTWFIAGFLSVCLVPGLIGGFIVYKDNGMALNEFIPFFIVLMGTLLFSIFIALRISLFKIDFKGGIFYKYHFFRIKKIELQKIEKYEFKKSRAFPNKNYILLYINNKRILKISCLLTNLETAKNILENGHKKEVE